MACRSECRPLLDYPGSRTSQTSGTTHRAPIAVYCWFACDSPDGPRSSTASNHCFERSRSPVGLRASLSPPIGSSVSDDLRARSPQVDRCAVEGCCHAGCHANRPFSGLNQLVRTARTPDLQGRRHTLSTIGFRRARFLSVIPVKLAVRLWIGRIWRAREVSNLSEVRRGPTPGACLRAGDPRRAPRVFGSRPPGAM